MDKWKEIELNKMSAGGNDKALRFFQSQPDYQKQWTLQQKYNSKAAALLRDKVDVGSKHVIIVLVMISLPFIFESTSKTLF